MTLFDNTRTLAVLTALLAPGAYANTPAAPQTISSHGANAVSAWDEAITKAVNQPSASDGTPEERMPLFGVDLATMHLAIYDAIVAITGTHQPYAITPTTPSMGASIEAAANAAAYGVVKGLFPARVNLYQATFDSRMAAISDGDSKARGTALGAEVARGMLARRADDGRHTPLAPYAHATTAGKFRAKAAVSRSLVHVRPFALTSASQFRASGPPALDSAAYAADLNETRTLGRATGSLRTAAQTEQALFHTEAPPRFLPHNLRQFATSQTNLADNARLMARLWMTLSDALIGCFESKYHYNFWRPETAITLADTSTNAATVPEPGWKPSMPTPPHPEYPAAHSCSAGAIAQSLTHHFRTDQISFVFTSGKPGTVAHPFASTAEMIEDLSLARLYGGMHFRGSTRDGAALGRQVADWVAQKYFQPLDRSLTRSSSPIMPIAAPVAGK